MTPFCSQCKTALPSDDINVAQDTAFCRRCNRAFKLSELVHETALPTPAELGKLPEGMWHRTNGIETRIGASHRSWAAAFGLLFFCLFWNGVVSIFVIGNLISTMALLGMPIPEWFPKLKGVKQGIGMTIGVWIFLLPFILVGLGMFVALLSSIWGKTEVRITDSACAIESGVRPFRRKKTFLRQNVRSVSLKEREWQGKGGRARSTKYLEIELTEGKPIKFADSLPEEKMKTLSGLVRDALRC